MKILIVDDHPIVRRGIRQVLGTEPDMETVGEADDAEAALELVRTGDWDLVILDLTMPARGGLDLLKDLRRERPKLPVLVVTMQPEDQYAVRALRMGVGGYLTKETAPENLVRAVRTVAGGGRYITPSVAQRLASRLDGAEPRPLHHTLSQREYQVTCMIASGRTVTEIARELSLSVKTVATYRARILEKMRMRTNAQLTHYGIKNGLVE